GCMSVFATDPTPSEQKRTRSIWVAFGIVMLAASCSVQTDGPAAPTSEEEVTTTCDPSRPPKPRLFDYTLTNSVNPGAGTALDRLVNSGRVVLGRPLHPGARTTLPDMNRVNAAQQIATRANALAALTTPETQLVPPPSYNTANLWPRQQRMREDLSALAY